MYSQLIKKKYPFLNNNININKDIRDEYNNILINISQIINDMNDKITYNNNEIQTLSDMLLENIQIYQNILLTLKK